MSRCSVDIETFSSADLAKCGVFKYVESPDFEILLIGIQLDDDEEPLVFDVRLCDERTKDYLRRLFTDPDVVKTAWNASFEITCLSKWLGVQLPFAQWLDTMVVAATLGLPRSLSVALRYPDIVMHIHDEMVVEVPTRCAELALRDITAVMGQPIPWAPGLLLRGDVYLCGFYQKD